MQKFEICENNSNNNIQLARQIEASQMRRSIDCKMKTVRALTRSDLKKKCSMAWLLTVLVVHSTLTLEIVAAGITTKTADQGDAFAPDVSLCSDSKAEYDDRVPTVVMDLEGIVMEWQWRLSPDGITEASSVVCAPGQPDLHLRHCALATPYTTSSGSSVGEDSTETRDGRKPSTSYYASPDSQMGVPATRITRVPSPSASPHQWHSEATEGTLNNSVTASVTGESVKFELETGLVDKNFAGRWKVEISWLAKASLAGHRVETLAIFDMVIVTGCSVVSDTFQVNPQPLVWNQSGAEDYFWAQRLESASRLALMSTSKGFSLADCEQIVEAGMEEHSVLALIAHGQDAKVAYQDDDNDFLTYLSLLQWRPVQDSLLELKFNFDPKMATKQPEMRERSRKVDLYISYDGDKFVKAVSAPLAFAPSAAQVSANSNDSQLAPYFAPPRELQQTDYECELYCLANVVQFAPLSSDPDSPVIVEYDPKTTSSNSSCSAAYDIKVDQQNFPVSDSDSCFWFQLVSQSVWIMANDLAANCPAAGEIRTQQFSFYAENGPSRTAFREYTINFTRSQDQLGQLQYQIPCEGTMATTSTALQFAWSSDTFTFVQYNQLYTFQKVQMYSTFPAITTTFDPTLYDQSFCVYSKTDYVAIANDGSALYDQCFTNAYAQQLTITDSQQIGTIQPNLVEGKQYKVNFNIDGPSFADISLVGEVVFVHILKEIADASNVQHKQFPFQIDNACNPDFITVEPTTVESYVIQAGSIPADMKAVQSFQFISRQAAPIFGAYPVEYDLLSASDPAVCGTPKFMYLRDADPQGGLIISQLGLSVDKYTGIITINQVDAIPDTANSDVEAQFVSFDFNLVFDPAQAYDKVQNVQLMIGLCEIDNIKFNDSVFPEAGSTVRLFREMSPMITFQSSNEILKTQYFTSGVGGFCSGTLSGLTLTLQNQQTVVAISNADETDYLQVTNDSGIGSFELKLATTLSIGSIESAREKVISFEVATLFESQYLRLSIKPSDDQPLVFAVEQDSELTHLNSIEKKYFEVKYILEQTVSALSDYTFPEPTVFSTSLENLQQGAEFPWHTLSPLPYQACNQQFIGDSQSTPMVKAAGSWTQAPIYIDCGPWNRDRAVAKSIKFAFDIHHAPVPDLKTSVSTTCTYAKCSNLKAVEQGTMENAEHYKIGMSNRMHTVDYVVHLDQLEVVLDPIHTFCFDERIHLLQASVMILPDGSEVPLLTEQDFYDRGIYVEQANMTTTLRVFSDDEALYDHQFEIQIKSTVSEEHAWYNTTWIKVNFLKPPCLVSRDEISEVGGDQSLSLNATRGMSQDEVSFSAVMELANQALRTSERVFCGTMQVAFISDDADFENFVSVDLVGKLVTIAPQLEDKAGYYDQAYLRFSYSDYPDRVMYVQIIADVDECIYQSASFISKKVDAVYQLGSTDLVIKLPGIQLTPDCGLDKLLIIGSEADVKETPDDLLFDSLVRFDQERLEVTILRQTSLSLLDKQVSARITVQTNVGLSASLEFSAEYASGGPWFVSTPVVPDITCSQQDKGWSLQLPAIGAADQQEVEVTFSIENKQLAKVFVFDSQSLTLSLDSKYEAQLIRGNLCPVFDTASLEFVLKSNVLGSRTYSYNLNKKIKSPASVSLFEFSYDWHQALNEQQASDDSFNLPSVEISSVSPTGEVTIQFSDAFVVHEDLQRIKREQMLTVSISPVEDQSEDSLKFDWQVKSFQETHMKIQLSFEDPYVISATETKNQLSIEVKNYDLFVRKKDGFSVSYDTVVALQLPQFGDNAIVETAQIAGETVGSVGKTQLVVIFLLNLLASHQLNKLLSQVRNLGLVTHFMLMKLMFPPITVVFFSGLFEYVTFDLIPTEDLYAYLFGWTNVAYSEEAESIGYPSRFFIENAGSIPLYIAIDIVLQLVYALAKLVLKSGSVRGYAERSQANFFWAGCNSKFNEVYLTVAFTVGINLSSMDFISASVAFNNCIALLMAAFLVISPLKTGLTLVKGWKRNSDEVNALEKAEAEQTEGGEEEPSSLSQLPHTQCTDVTNVTMLHTQPHLEQQDQSQEPSPSKPDLALLSAEAEKRKAKLKEQQLLELDTKLGESVGSISVQLAGRRRLSRSLAIRFFYAAYLRRFLQAAIILSLFDYNVLQVSLSLLLNLLYVCMLVAVKPFKDRVEQWYEFQNEFVLLATLEFMLLFVGQATEGSQRESAGLVIVCIICLNFALNLLPIVVLLKQTVFQLITQCKQRQAQKRFQRYLQQRTAEEKFYDTRLTLRVQQAQFNNELIVDLENEARVGHQTITDQDFAIVAQDVFNIERQDDSSYEEGEEGEDEEEEKNSEIDGSEDEAGQVNRNRDSLVFDDGVEPGHQDRKIELQRNATASQHIPDSRLIDVRTEEEKREQLMKVKEELKQTVQAAEKTLKQLKKLPNYEQIEKEIIEKLQQFSSYEQIEKEIEEMNIEVEDEPALNMIKTQPDVSSKPAASKEKQKRAEKMSAHQLEDLDVAREEDCAD